MVVVAGEGIAGRNGELGLESEATVIIHDLTFRQVYFTI